MIVTTYQRPSVHLGPLTCPCYTGQTAQIIYYPGSDQAAPYSHFGFRCVIPARNGPLEYWPLHRTDWRNTLTYAHTTSRVLPTWDMSLGSLTVAIPKARDFVESLEPYFGFPLAVIDLSAFHTGVLISP